MVALRQGGPVALIRHTDAPGGLGDSPGSRLDDCATQRDLSAKGQADAKAVGQNFRGEGVAIGKLLSSPWCRCVDTARLMDRGAVEIEPTFSNVVIMIDQRAALTKGAGAVINGWKGSETLLIVTHAREYSRADRPQSCLGGGCCRSDRFRQNLCGVGRVPVPVR
jgi:phosphohistidine phosphatase SixA